MDKVYRISYISIPSKVKNTFKDSGCILIISVGQEYHERDKLLATLNSINTYFKSCKILLADTLQRHTLSLNKRASTVELLQLSRLLGDEWISRNTCIIENSLKIDYNIIRWDTYLNNPEFKKKYNFIMSLFKYDSNFNKIVQTEAQDFISRFKSTINFESALEKCIEYLIEECSAMCLWIDEKCEFQLYPKGLNNSMHYINKNIIAPSNPGLLNEVGFQIRRVK